VGGWLLIPVFNTDRDHQTNALLVSQPTTVCISKQFLQGKETAKYTENIFCKQIIKESFFISLLQKQRIITGHVIYQTLMVYTTH